MKTVRTIAEVRSLVAAAKGAGQKVGLIPTMGYLHEGHLSLIDEARSGGARFIVVSIFVNPSQFGPHEDFEKYPRDEKRDAELLREKGVDLLFAPAVAEMYPDGFHSSVHIGGVSEPLEGERRPGHFDGVATVVLKLFNIVMPDLAVFGQKDAQQCGVISHMVRDLDVPVRLVIAKTRREESGLAMSSRNSYLSESERQLAPALQRALRKGQAALGAAATTTEVEQEMLESLQLSPGVQADYLRLVDPETFAAPRDLDRELLLVGAVRIGKTRLIDNIRLERTRK